MRKLILITASLLIVGCYSFLPPSSMPDGYGTYTYNNAEYSGEWLNGKHNGKGIMRWPNGDVYEGEWLNDKRHGKGILRLNDGQVYEGEWLNDMRNGKGTLTMNNGNKYVGEWLNDMRNGKGTTTWANGDKYEGEYKNNLKHGQGTLRLNDGEVYEGEFVNDMRIMPDGYGTYTYTDGEYSGEWLNSKRHGQGTMTWASGTIYKGFWEEDYQTVGIEYLLNGNKFNLSYYNPLTKEAIGDYYFADGNIIKDAHFINGLLNGEATLICAETSKCAGQQIKGNWKDGEFVRSSSPLADFLEEIIIETLTGLPAAYVESKAREKAYKKGYIEGARKNRKRGPQPLPKNEPCGASCPN